RPVCCRRSVVHPAAKAKTTGTPTRTSRNSQAAIWNTICHRKNRPPARRHFLHPSPMEHCRRSTESNRMNRNTLLMYRKTKANTIAAKITTKINPMNCPKCAGMCVGLKGGQPEGRLEDGSNRPPLLCGMRGQLPPKFPKLHPPTCNSAARIPTSARRDHCPKRKRVKSCSRACCNAGCTQSTAETGTDAPHSDTSTLKRISPKNNKN